MAQYVISYFLMAAVLKMVHPNMFPMTYSFDVGGGLRRKNSVLDCPGGGGSALQPQLAHGLVYF